MNIEALLLRFVDHVMFFFQYFFAVFFLCLKSTTIVVLKRPEKVGEIRGQHQSSRN